MPIQFKTLTAPAQWASYLINGDSSGLEPYEKAQADSWFKREGVKVIVDCGEEYFSKFLWLHAPECGFPHGTVCDYTCEIADSEMLATIARE